MQHGAVSSLAVLLCPCRRRQKRLQKLAKGKALKGKFTDMPLLGSMPPTVLGVTSEKFGDDLRQYLEKNPDHSLSSTESGMLPAGQRCTMPLRGDVSQFGGDLKSLWRSAESGKGSRLGMVRRWLNGSVCHAPQGAPGHTDL